MTTQAVKATVGSGTFSKIFNLTATDGQWDGNSLTDSISNQPLGILIPGARISNVCATYSNGLMAWRIQNAQTLQVSRRGFASKVGFSCYDSCKVSPYNINPNDIISVYPLPVDATSSQSNCLAWVTTTKGTELFKAQDIPDSTSTALTTVVNSQSLGDNMFGSTLQSIWVQAEDDCTVNKVEIFDNSGAVVFTAFGGVRNAPGSSSNYYNIDVSGLGIAIGRGWAIKVNCTSA